MACEKEKAALTKAQDKVDDIQDRLAQAAKNKDYVTVVALLKTQGTAQTALQLAKLKLQSCEVRWAVARATRVP